jgi:diacylglycerol O-acyltransferase / wax synthase
MSDSVHMGSADAAWLRMDGPANPMVINALIRFERPLEAGDLEEVLRQRLVEPYPKFAMRPRAGRLALIGSLPAPSPLPAVGASWKPDPRFSIGRHLHRLALPSPGGDQELRQLVGDLVSTPLPADRPPWEAHLIEGKAGATAMLVRMHHCIADGIALAHVLLSLTDDVSGGNDEGAVGVAQAVGPPVGPRLGEQVLRLAREGAATALHPGRLVALAHDGVRDAETLARLLMLPSESGETELSGVRQIGFSAPVELELVKQIGHRHQATVNDVLLAAVAGAMRGRLPDHGAATPRMTAIVPFDLRQGDAAAPVELGNHFGLVFLRLPTGERVRTRRLALVKARMDAIKSSPEGALTYAVLQAMGAAPAAVQERLVELFSAKGTAVITDVPGPTRPRRLAGVVVRDLAIWAPASGSVGMSVSLFSYRGQVTIGLLADTAVLQDPQAVADRVVHEIEALAPARRSVA